MHPRWTRCVCSGKSAKKRRSARSMHLIGRRELLKMVIHIDRSQEEEEGERYHLEINSWPSPEKLVSRVYMRRWTNYCYSLTQRWDDWNGMVDDLISYKMISFAFTLRRVFLPSIGHSFVLRLTICVCLGRQRWCRSRCCRYCCCIVTWSPHVQRDWRAGNFHGIEVNAYFLDTQRFRSELAKLSIWVQLFQGQVHTLVLHVDQLMGWRIGSGRNRDKWFIYIWTPRSERWSRFVCSITSVEWSSSPSSWPVYI